MENKINIKLKSSKEIGSHQKREDIIKTKIHGVFTKNAFLIIPKNINMKYRIICYPYKLLHKQTVNVNNDSGLTESFLNMELSYEVIHNFPLPVFICSSAGSIIFINKALMDFVETDNTNCHAFNCNVLHDRNFEKWGIRDFLLSAYTGEITRTYDVKVPCNELISMFGGKKDQRDISLLLNLSAYPIRDKNNGILYIVVAITTYRTFVNRDEVEKGIAYIEAHWKEKFDIEVLADLVFLSKYHYSRIFKEQTGLTPFKFYQNIKIARIKERLITSDLSIAEIFAECGVDYNGNFIKTFKTMAGMTPSEYRAANKKAKQSQTGFTGE